MKFQVRQDAGPHYTKRGNREVEYVPGDVLESNVDMMKKYPNKFLKVDDATPVTVKKPMKGKLNLSSMRGKTFPEDAAPVTTKPEATAPKGKGKKSKKDKADEEEEEEEDEEEEVEEVNKYGKNVTADFSDAIAKNLLVRKKGTSFNVFDSEEGKPLNKKRLKKKQVSDFIEAYEPDDAGEEDEETEDED